MDLAVIDLLRTRKLGVPRYNEFRKLLHLRPVRTFEELTDNKQWVEQLRRVYDNDIDRVDPMIGMYNDNTMSTVLLRHYPALGPVLRGVKNAFAPWSRVTV